LLDADGPALDPAACGNEPGSALFNVLGRALGACSLHPALVCIALPLCLRRHGAGVASMRVGVIAMLLSGYQARGTRHDYCIVIALHGRAATLRRCVTPVCAAIH